MRYESPSIVDFGSIAKHTFNHQTGHVGCEPFPGGAGQDGVPKGTATTIDKFCFQSLHASP